MIAFDPFRRLIRVYCRLKRPLFRVSLSASSTHFQNTCPILDLPTLEAATPTYYNNFLGNFHTFWKKTGHRFWLSWHIQGVVGLARNLTNWNASHLSDQISEFTIFYLYKAFAPYFVNLTLIFSHSSHQKNWKIGFHLIIKERPPVKSGT